ncbi:DNA primase [Streptomyces alfalfae]|uniref:DNA primase n=1 Tax=Streptomyces alfalfae TaxID=1642299 RepID=A0ABM6GQ69_9ACTN|nr:DNA primase [Streptomyces alfalfae]APY85358.1 DNA primase [Streptomyces alfalfae]AYA15706.1 DNA primase [Streptomyces fradiae]RXX39183.1 DNA primase [Streptomyces alfalfae]RZM99299.1 DNA primase [Streptomyces alfalfae]
MNRLAVGLAVGAGYVLGRTKKAKFAFAVGTMVAGKRLNLSPKALGSLVTQQLENNPQFKEIGDQLRQDLRGVGKAATGSLLNRQLEGLADRLHDRTLDVQDRIAGVVPDDAKNLKGKVVGRDDEDEEDDEGDRDDGDREDRERKSASDDDRQHDKAPAKRSSGSRSASKSDAKSAPRAATKKAPARKTAQKTARKTTQKKTTAARGTARRATSARSGGTSKGGRDNG